MDQAKISDDNLQKIWRLSSKKIDLVYLLQVI